jgi:PRC-barrel domain
MGSIAIAGAFFLAPQDQAAASTRLLRLAQATNSEAPQPKSDDNDKEKAKKEEKAGTPATVVDGQQLESVLGLDAVNAKGDNMGRIVDIIVDRAGQVRAAIIDFGGFLGVGSRKIAVDWSVIHFAPDRKSSTVVVDLSRDQLRVAPVYKSCEPVVVIGGSPAKP